MSETLLAPPANRHDLTPEGNLQEVDGQIGMPEALIPAESLLGAVATPEQTEAQTTVPTTTPETGEAATDERSQYIEQALRNLKNTSRTAAGTIDTSASVTKADAMVEGLSSEEIADTAVNNFTETIGELYDLREVNPTSPEDLRGLVEAAARQINGGLLKEGKLIRGGADVDKYGYTRVAELEPAMAEFYETFYAKLNDPDTDPKSLAGWVEYRIDLTDHFFADGCGKTAKAVSAWVLMRANLPLPTYRGRDELYENAPHAIRNQDAATTAKEEAAWQGYYASLF